MANSKLLKEAIADVKAVKETALANAKLALEEAFTPQLTAMFAENVKMLLTEIRNKPYPLPEALVNLVELKDVVLELRRQ